MTRSIEALDTSRHRVDVLKKNIKDAAKRRFMPGVIERSVDALFMQAGFENIDLLKDPIKDGNVLLITPAHESLYDMGPAIKVAKEVQKRIPSLEGFNIVFSKTIDQGNQGAETQSGFRNGARQFLERNGAQIIEVASDNDVKLRGATQTREDTRKVSDALQDKKRALIVFPEANMDAGRRATPESEKNGTGMMDRNVQTILGHALKRNMPIVVLPVGLYGSSEIYDPTHRKVTQEGMELIMKAELGRIVPHMMPEKIGFIKVEKPFLLQVLKEFENPMEELMMRIAIGVPPEGRGIWKDKLRGKRSQ